MEEEIDRLCQTSSRSTVNNYRSAYRKFSEFRMGQDFPVSQLTSDMVRRYESWLLSQSLYRNTVSFHLRILRAVYHRLVDDDGFPRSDPFRRAYTGIDKTVKRAVRKDIVGQLIALDLSSDASLSLARDLFLFSFYARGMSFVDMAYLKKSDIQDHQLSYCRLKTHRRITIHVTPPLQAIINRYYLPSSPYLLPIITRPDDEWLQYKSADRSQNRALKKLGAMLRHPQNLTMYMARHSWASIAHNEGVSMAVVSRCMGHESESTTLIYLTSMGQEELDRANDIVINAVMRASGTKRSSGHNK